MATGPTPDNRQFLFRLLTLIIDGGSGVLRNILDQRLQNTPLHTFLAREKTTIDRLRLYKDQNVQLYPPGSQNPNSADFDIPLIIKLLKNIPSLGLRQNYSWNSQPQSIDHSIEADLCRLKRYRNEIAHISSTQGFDKTTFQTYWSDIEQVLLRLNAALTNPDPNLKQTIEDCKTKALDPEAERRLLQEIERWQEMEKDLDTKMQLMQKDVKHVKGAIGEIKESVQKVVEMVSEQRNDLEVFKGKVYDDIRKINERDQKMGELLSEKRNFTETTPKKVFAGNIGNVKARVQKIEKMLSEQNNVTETKHKKGDGNNGKVKAKVQKIEQMLSDQSTLTASKHKNGKKTMEKAEKVDHHFLSKFQKDLIGLYRRRHASICLSPLLEEVDIPLHTLYQKPDFNYVQVQWALGGGKEIRTPVENFSDLFFEDNKVYDEIYLIGDAGFGKTSFCRRLVLTWCQAKNHISDENKYFSREEIRTLNRFEVVYLLTLRDSTRECNIDEMIYNQIVSRLDGTYSLADLENILSKTKSLVILDGLDEWTHPSIPCRYGFSDIPHRRARKWTVLTTTRAWKLCRISVKMSEIDRTLELSGFSQDSANNLKMAMISHILKLTCDKTLNKKIQEFNNDLRKHGISSLERNPLMLIYLLCLWCDKSELGESLSELYTNMVELLLLKTAKKYKEGRLLLQRLTSGAQPDIPECFVKHKMCFKYFQLLKYLSKMSFDAFISGTFENNLVFDSEDDKLNQELLHFCFQSGILTQSKIRGKLTNQEIKMSFVHETVQEFFIALYMHINPDKGLAERNSIWQCKCVNDILGMSKVFIFLAGINVHVFSSISRELMIVVNCDELTKNFRTLTHFYTRVESSQSLKELQNIGILCLKENPDNTELNICLQDIFIDKDCMQEAYYKHLRKLAVLNKKNLKSVSIRMEGIPYNSHEIISDLKLVDLSSVEKIYFRGSFSDCDITPLLHRSIKCLSLISYKWCDDKFISEDVTWSASLCNRVKCLDNLNAIQLSHFKMCHNQLEELVKYLSARTSMLEILLQNVFCTTHRAACTGFLLDLSQHERLSLLGLHNIPLSAMKINVSSLERCHVGRLTTPGLSRFLSYLPAASKLHTFFCNDLNSEDIDGMLNTLSSLGQTRKVYLFNIRLMNRKLPISRMKNVYFVVLIGVEMTASTFCCLVNSVQNLPQRVTVYTSDCIVTPGEEFERQKEKIKRSPYFKVTCYSSKQKQKFVFKTIKET